MPLGAIVVHQLRYRLAYGSHAGAVLTSQGHAYLTSFAPWLVLLLCLAVGGLVARVAQAVARGRPGRRRARSLAAVWGTCSAGLLAVYAVQELLEGFFAAGHPGGLGGVAGHGGWWAVPSAVVAGAAIAALLRVATVAVDAAVRLGDTRPAPPLVARASWAVTAAFSPRAVPLASAAAGRAPPPGFV
jgi:hypothetical protein